MTTTLSDIGEIFDGPHATPKRLTSGSKMFLNISSLNQGRLDLDQSDWISDDEFAKWTRRVTPQPGDLLFSYETRLGEAALMPTGIDACLGRRMALLRPDTTVVDSQFLLYFWLSPYFKQLIDQRAIHGATVDRIPLSELGDWPVTLPTLEDQHAIAEVLSALDDKIAANRRSLEIADSLLEAKVREITKDRERATKLGDLLTLNYGKSLPKSKRTAGNVQVVGSGGINGTHNQALLDGPSVIVGRKGTVGSTYWINGPSYPIDTTFWVESENTPLIYAYYLLQTIDFASMSADSAVPGLNRDRAYSELVPSVPLEDMQRFAVFSQDVSELMEAIRTESRALAATRDELLPLLMSGKITVADAEKRITE